MRILRKNQRMRSMMAKGSIAATVAGEVVAILTADEEEELRDTGAVRSEILKLTSEARTRL
jgi:hypothetical protein